MALISGVVNRDEIESKVEVLGDSQYYISPFKSGEYEPYDIFAANTRILPFVPAGCEVVWRDKTWATIELRCKGVATVIPGATMIKFNEAIAANKEMCLLYDGPYAEVIASFIEGILENTDGKRAGRSSLDKGRIYVAMVSDDDYESIYNSAYVFVITLIQMIQDRGGLLLDPLLDRRFIADWSLVPGVLIRLSDDPHNIGVTTASTGSIYIPTWDDSRITRDRFTFLSERAAIYPAAGYTDYLIRGVHTSAMTITYKDTKELAERIDKNMLLKDVEPTPT